MTIFFVNPRLEYRVTDYRKILLSERYNEMDFIYLDPPYDPTMLQQSLLPIPIADLTHIPSWNSLNFSEDYTRKNARFY